MDTQIIEYLRSYCSYAHDKDGAWKDFTDPIEEEVAHVYYGNIKKDKNGQFMEVPYSTYSDYSGGTVERSNCRTFLDMFKEFGQKDLWEIYGGYSTTGVLIRLSLYQDNEEVKDVIDGLFNYPLINEDDLSELEIEIENEVWDSWIKSDLVNELEKRNIPYIEDDLYHDMLHVMNEINEYFNHEDAVSVYVDIEKIVDNWQEIKED